MENLALMIARLEMLERTNIVATVRERSRWHHVAASMAKIHGLEMERNISELKDLLSSTTIIAKEYPLARDHGAVGETTRRTWLVGS